MVTVDGNTELDYAIKRLAAGVYSSLWRDVNDVTDPSHAVGAFCGGDCSRWCVFTVDDVNDTEPGHAIKCSAGKRVGAWGGGGGGRDVARGVWLL